MADSPLPRQHWYLRIRWLILIGLISNGFGWFVVNWDKVETNVPRMVDRAAWLVSKVRQQPAPAPAPTPPAVAEAPKPPPAPPPKPTVQPLRSSDEMTAMLRTLGGSKWEPNFDRHFKNRETSMVLEVVAVGDLRIKMRSGGENFAPVFYVTPRSRGDLKRFKPGMFVLVEGDLERYTDTGFLQSDEVYIVRAKLTEKPAASIATGSIGR